MKTTLYIAAALVAVQGAAWATPAAGASPAADDAAYAERMHLIGRTPEPAERAVPLTDEQAAHTADERRQAYLTRMALVGRTPGAGELAAAVARGPELVAAAPSFEERMKLIGRSTTAQ